jgi:broad specificity phosphatase PhoE
MRDAGPPQAAALDDRLFPPCVRLLLVRHGETAWNRAGRYQGSADVPLNEIGEQQAQALAVQLRGEPIAAVYASGLRRALATAAPIATEHGLAVVRDVRLNEINQGQWEGLRPIEIVVQWASLHAQWEREPLTVRPPGGETLDEVRARVLAAVDEIAARWAGSTVCVVAHKVSLAVIKAEACDISLTAALAEMPPNASIEAVELEVRPPSVARALDGRVAPTRHGVGSS